jgi:hypothetical protein
MPLENERLASIASAFLSQRQWLPRLKFERELPPIVLIDANSFGGPEFAIIDPD